jgi:excisionase family DNA binding protein
MVKTFDEKLSTTEAAELLELTSERIRQLIASGHIPALVNGKVALAAVVRGYIHFRNEDDRRTSKSASASRVQDARAREIELKVAEREGRLIDIVEHRELYGEVFGTLKADMNGVGQRFGRDQAQRRQIEQGIDAIFDKAADRFEKGTRDIVGASEAGEVVEGNDA